MLFYFMNDYAKCMLLLISRLVCQLVIIIRDQFVNKYICFGGKFLEGKFI